MGAVCDVIASIWRRVSEYLRIGVPWSSRLRHQYVRQFWRDRSLLEESIYSIKVCSESLAMSNNKTQWLKTQVYRIKIYSHKLTGRVSATYYNSVPLQTACS